MFTDNPNLKSKHWQIVHYDEPDLPRWLMARKVYIMSHMFMPDYDLTVLIGGQMRVNCNLDDFVRGKTGADMAVARHPDRSTVQEEISACVRLKKFSRAHARKLRKRYHGVRDIRLPQLAVIIRTRVPPEFEQLWYDETAIARRDQIAFCHCASQVEINLQYYSWAEIPGNFIKHKHLKK